MSPKKIPQSLIDAIKKHPERVTAKSISLDKNIISGKGIKKNNEMIPLKKAPIKMKMPEQTQVIGMQTVGAKNIPPSKKNKKSKL